MKEFKLVDSNSEESDENQQELNISKNPLNEDDNQINIKSLFKVRNCDEIINVENCTFINDIEEVSTFYFCPCSNEEFYPICEACAKKCHKKHNPTQTIKGIYICKCGECNHLITEENEKIFEERKKQIGHLCFYTEFMKITPGTGFYNYKGKTYCGVCINHCVELEIDEREQIEKFKTNLKKECNCLKHFEQNLVNLNLDFESKPKFNTCFENINFNILAKIPLTQEKIFKYLINKIQIYIDNTSKKGSSPGEESKIFFSDFITGKILECFSLFSHRFENKYFFIDDYLKQFPKEKLLQLMKMTEDILSIDAGVRGQFFKTKLHFAEFLFNYLIRRFNIQNNNLWNIRTILNMNLFQRRIYLQETKSFFKFQNKKDLYNEKLIRVYTDNILELYEIIYHFCENDKDTLKNELLDYYFPNLNYITKYLMKINFFAPDQIEKYFDLVFDTIMLWNDMQKKVQTIKKETEEISLKEINEEKEFQKTLEASQGYKLRKLLEWIQASQFTLQVTSKIPVKKMIEDQDIKKEIIFEPHSENNKLTTIFYIMKSILYTLLYENDRQCYNYLKGNYNKIKDNFIFEKAPFTDKICKIFMMIVKKFYRKGILSNTVMYDFFVSKILELLINKQDENFYIKSLENLNNLPAKDIKLISSDNLFEDAIKDINKIYLKSFNDFCEKLTLENRKFLNYEINFNKYLTNALVIIENFKKYIETEFSTIPGCGVDIKLKYLHFIGLTKDNIYYEKLKEFQKACNFSLFYRCMEEFIYIYNEGKKFNNIPLKKTVPILNFILSLYYLLAHHNHENLLLVMNIKPFIFVETFSDTFIVMINFLERLSEMFYTGDYKFDNFYFFSKCLCMILLRSEKIIRAKQNLTNEEQVMILEKLGHVFYLANKIIGYVSINQYDYINILDSIQHFTQKVQNDGRFSCLKDLANSYLTDVKPNPKLKVFFSNYFIYLSNLIEKDFYFFTITSPKNTYLVDLKSIIENLETIVFKKIIDLEDEYSMLRYYFSYKLKFDITTNRIQNQAIRIFRNNHLFDEVTINSELSDGEENDDERNTDSYNTNNTESKNDNKVLNNNESNQKIRLDYINASLVNLIINENTSDKKNFENVIRKKIENLKQVAKILFLVVQRFEERLEIIVENKNGKFENLYEIYNFLLNYFEHVILRPLYKLVNLFMLHSQFILGKDCTVYHGLVFETLKLTVKLYINLTNILNNSNSPIIQLNSESKYYSNYFSKPVILSYENISLKKNLTQKELDDIMEDIQNLYKMKYYHIADIFKILVQNIDRILYIKPKIVEKTKSEHFMTLKRIDEESKPECIQRLDNLIKEYKNTLEKTFDNGLSLFSALESSEKEMDIEIGKELLLYLLDKMCDDLTDENVYHYEMDKIEYQEAYLSKVNIRHFKLQNSYILIYLNALFYNYSEQFQNYLRESIGKYFDNIFLFLILNIIFACNINENTKVYTFDQICDYNNEGERNRSLCLDICTLAIKFIQNMCEGHNQIFQQRFFNFKLNIDQMNYIDEEIEKELDFQIQKQEDSEYYSIYHFDEPKKKRKKRRPEIINRRALMLNSPWFKNLYVFLNSEPGKEIFRLPELKIVDILRKFIIQLNDRKRRGKIIKDLPDQEILEKERLKKEEEERIENEKKNQKKNKFSMHAIFQKFLKTHESLRDLRSSKNIKTINEEIDKEALKRDKNFLIEKKYSFLNFLFNNMRLIIDNLHISDKLQAQIFKKTQNIKSTDDLLDIHQHFADLVVEMIQGTDTENFDNFYKKLTRPCKIFDDNDNLNYDSLQSFLFIHQCIEIAQFLWIGTNLFNENALKIILTIFDVINNIITQEINDIELIQIITKIFPPEKLIHVISEYLKGLVVKYINNTEYDDPDFEEQLFECNLDEVKLQKMKNLFKQNMDIYSDEYFSLAAKMYLYITVLGKSFKEEEAAKILEYENKDLHKIKDNTKKKGVVSVLSLKDMTNDFSDVKTFINYLTLQKKKTTLRLKKGNIKEKINNYIVTAKFFKKVIKNCEFMIEKDGSLQLKIIYFIVDPKVYYIDKNNIEKFFYEVDRSSSTTKLKALIESLNNYMYEVNFKYDYFKTENSKKWMFDINYKTVDLLNFCCSLIINTILLIFLDKKDQYFSFVYISTFALSVIQILFNLVYLYFFYQSKYKSNVILAESEFEDKEMSYFDKIKVYYLDTFLLDDDVSLMILISIMALLSLISDKLQFLYALQLLSVVKFVETIKIIVISFQMQIFQLFSILGFLLIFIFFYANISYTFFKDEFLLELDEKTGKKGNICSSLLECTITYFNHGVRSGGGIGDILPEEEFTSAMYWVRMLNDFIFFIAVVLMLLNMINGVIVSTFSEIREESNFKEDDQNNKCFICNIDRLIFERLKIKFEDHLKSEHNVKTYIRFLIGVKLINEKDMDADQSFISGCLKNNEIKMFPVGISTSTGEIKDDEEKEKNEDEDEE